MPSRETKFRVLLSSPSGLDLEREAVGSVVAELNQSWGPLNASVIELLKWETSVSPGAGSEPQDVINKGLGENWDIYLGLMYTRFGTPTKNFGSGTEEEFINAYKLWELDRQNRRLIFYFKKTPVDPDEIDITQLERVREFKKTLSAKGCVYGSFLTVRELEGFLRVNLTKQLSEILASYSKIIPSTSSEASGSVPKVEKDGAYLNLSDSVENGSKEIRRVFEELNQLMGLLTVSANEAAPKMAEALKKNDLVGLTQAESELSKDLTTGARKLSTIRRKYAGLSLVFFDNITKLISLSLSQAPQKHKQDFKKIVEEALSKVEFLRDKSESANQALDGWEKHVAIDLNNARLSFQMELTKFTFAVEETISQIKELLKLF